jgi:hypothetical protein
MLTGGERAQKITFQKTKRTFKFCKAPLAIMNTCFPASALASSVLAGGHYTKKDYSRSHSAHIPEASVNVVLASTSNICLGLSINSPTGLRVLFYGCVETKSDFSLHLRWGVYFLFLV